MLLESLKKKEHKLYETLESDIKKAEMMEKCIKAEQTRKKNAISFSKSN